MGHSENIKIQIRIGHQRPKEDTRHNYLANVYGQHQALNKNSTVKISVPQMIKSMRFLTECGIDFDGIDEPGWTKRTVTQLQEDYDHGARGVKIFKNLGLTVLDSKGNRFPGGECGL